MSMIKLPATYNTPDVEIDAVSGKIKISGICTPENPKEFFQPIFDNFQQLLEEGQRVILHLDFEYFNTGSSRCILDLCRIADGLDKSAAVQTNWFYAKDDLEMKEAGEMLSSICQFKFNLLEKMD
jgi:hypothetical protein